MGSRHDLYIDSEGVRRGYYVYLHRVRSTGQVFYVGKGYGRRAWQKSNRSEEWKKVVESEGWIVEIAFDDLSEIEAFERESELVAQHGGPESLGGTLTNWMPGGADSAAVSIEFAIGFGCKLDELSLKELPRERQESIAVGLRVKLEELLERLRAVEERAEERDDDELADSVSDVEPILGTVYEFCTDFIQRRRSWKELAIALEEASDDLATEELADYHRSVRGTLTKASRMVQKTLSLILAEGRDS